MNCEWQKVANLICLNRDLRLQESLAKRSDGPRAPRTRAGVRAAGRGEKRAWREAKAGAVLPRGRGADAAFGTSFRSSPCETRMAVGARRGPWTVALSPPRLTAGTASACPAGLSWTGFPKGSHRQRCHDASP